MFHVYLAGPITGLSFDNCINWREWFIRGLPSQIVGLSPLRGKDYLEGEEEVKHQYADWVLSTERGLTTRDYNDVKRSELIVANLFGAKTVSIGTVMEIAWARAMQKPVILIMEKEGNLHDHPMIRDSVGYRVETLDEALWLTKVILLPAPHRKVDRYTKAADACQANRAAEEFSKYLSQSDGQVGGK